MEDQTHLNQEETDTLLSVLKESVEGMAPLFYWSGNSWTIISIIMVLNEMMNRYHPLTDASVIAPCFASILYGIYVARRK